MSSNALTVKFADGQGVGGAFPDGNSAPMLVCARLRHVAGWIYRSHLFTSIDSKLVEIRASILEKLRTGEKSEGKIVKELKDGKLFRLC